MSERYISVTDDEYVYVLDTKSKNYKTLEDFEKAEFENAKKDNIDVKEYEDDILQSAFDKYWVYVYENHIEADVICDLLNEKEKRIRLENDIISLEKENFELKSIKRFAEKNRINIFHIETAFRNCWNDNAKLVGENKQLKKENEQLKKELFESEKDYLIENYSDNPTRRDEKIRALTEEFKERFGDLE